jgi:hypothetical protein
MEQLPPKHPQRPWQALVSRSSVSQPTGFATLWQTVDCVLSQLIFGRLWCIVESGRTVRPWMPFGAASHGAVYMALRWFSCTRGAVGWVSQQVAPSSRWIFLWIEQPVAWWRAVLVCTSKTKSHSPCSVFLGSRLQAPDQGVHCVIHCWGGDML